VRDSIISFFSHRSFTVRKQNERSVVSILHSVRTTLSIHKQLKREKNTDGQSSIKNKIIETISYKIIMTNTDIQDKEVSQLENHIPYISQQPIDRHLIEITDKNKSVFINAGIDSTW